MTDLIVVPNLPLASRFLLHIVFRLAQVPAINMMTLPEYKTMLEEVGFTNVTIEDISSDVYPGLLRFIQQRGEEDLASVFNREWSGMKMYARVLGWWSGYSPTTGEHSGRGKLDFVLVSASKPPLSKLY